MANFMCHLDWAQTIDKTLYLCVSVRKFPEEISICISRVSKEDLLSPVCTGIIKLSRGPKQKANAKEVQIYFSSATKTLSSTLRQQELQVGSLDSGTYNSLHDPYPCAYTASSSPGLLAHTESHHWL
jgi:hypothetical protein